MEWPFRYTDRYGTESTTLTNDGTILRAVIRGVAFSGDDFDQLEPDPGVPDELLRSRFVLNHNTLCSCVLEGVLPVDVASAASQRRVLLEFRLELGDPAPNGGIDRELLRLALGVGGERYMSSGRSGYFDDELADLAGMLPDGIRLKCCWTCAYSDYLPAGWGLFGCMACFRDNKGAYLRTQTKEQLFEIWDTRTAFVQETYLCPEHAWRVRDTGYRG